MQIWDYNLDETITFHVVYTFEENQHVIDHEISSVYHGISKREMAISVSWNFEEKMEVGLS